MFRASVCPSAGEKLLYVCDIGICHSVWVASGLRVGLKLQPADQTIQKEEVHIASKIVIALYINKKKYIVRVYFTATFEEHSF